MTEDQERQRRARERLAALEAQDSAQRAEARERVHAAQERERQERQHRTAASRRRAEHRAQTARTPVEDTGATEPPATGGERSPAAPEAETSSEPVTAIAGESTMSVYEVKELFNHPLGDGEMRQALRVLADDPAWSREADQEQDQVDRLTFVLVHQPSGTRVDVAQERSLLGIWNSRI